MNWPSNNDCERRATGPLRSVERPVLTTQVLRAVAERFGVDDQQVRRDHLISLLLAVLSAEFADQILFFGGTSLSRTYLPVGRLSEDIDLIATDRKTTAALLDQRLPRSVQTELRPIGLGTGAQRGATARLRGVEHV